MDYFASGLQTTVTVDVLDRQSMQNLGTLDGVTQVSLEKNIYNEYRMGGSVEVELREPVSWRSVMLRIWGHLRLGSEEEKHPLLTGLPKVAGDTRTDTTLKLSAILKDTTALLDDALGRTWAYADGQNVAAAIGVILMFLGVRANVTPSDKTLRSPQSWPPEATYRRMITDLAATIGYAAPWSDSMGTIFVQPYLSPSERAEVFQVGWGARSVTIPNLKREYPDELPNHFVLYTGDENPLVAEGWNDDPDSPYSTVNQATVPYTAQVDAADQASLNQQLAIVMAEYRNGSRTYELAHRWFPLDSDRVIELQSAGRINAPAYYCDGALVQEPLDVKVSLVQQSFSWQNGEPIGHVTTRLREAV